MIKAVLISIILTLLFLYNFILNLDKPIELFKVDTFLPMIIMRHFMDIIFSQNWQQFPNLPIFYGFEKSLFFSDLLLPQVILALPIFLITKNIILTFNLTAVIFVIISFWSMFKLARLFTKKLIPSLMAAIIFVFNPFIFTRFPDHLVIYTLAFIPLTFLFFEKFLVNPRSKNTFFLFFFLTCQLVSGLYYFTYLTIILPIYIFFRFRQEHLPLSKLLNKGTIVGLLILITTGAVLGTSYLQIFSQPSINRDPAEAPLYSAWLSDWFFAGPNNLVYGNLRDRVFNLNPNLVLYSSTNEERNLLWGVIPFCLFLLSFKLARDHFKWWSLFLGLLIVSFVLASGPKIHITQDLSIPGPYQLINYLHPLIPNTRAISRFAVFVFFFLGLIAALTLSQLLKNINGKKAIVLGLIIIVLTLLEYWNKPWKFTPVSPPVRQFYSVLESFDLEVILDLPIGNIFSDVATLAEDKYIDSTYMLWAATLHSKKIINGNSGFIPPEYTERSKFLSANFPTAAKLEKVKSWGVDGIVLHKDNFKQELEYERIKAQLVALGVPVVSATDNLTLFDLAKWTRIP